MAGFLVLFGFAGNEKGHSLREAVAFAENPGWTNYVMSRFPLATRHGATP